MVEDRLLGSSHSNHSTRGRCSFLVEPSVVCGQVYTDFKPPLLKRAQALLNILSSDASTATQVCSATWKLSIPPGRLVCSRQQPARPSGEDRRMAIQPLGKDKISSMSHPPPESATQAASVYRQHTDMQSDRGPWPMENAAPMYTQTRAGADALHRASTMTPSSQSRVYPSPERIVGAAASCSWLNKVEGYVQGQVHTD